MDLVKLHGLGPALDWINNSVKEHSMAKYLLPMARNLTTGETVKTQDLTGERFRLNQRGLAEDMANQLADKMTARTQSPWLGFVQEYTPTYRRS